MASPPYNHNYGTSVSPPYPSHTPPPTMGKKRTSDVSSNPPVKRRKASMMSTTSNLSAHPLRQTSFPPDGTDHLSQLARSPSVDTMSLVSGSAVTKSKRGRKPKVKPADDTASLAGGRALTARSGTSGRNVRGGTRGNSVDEEDDEAGDVMDVTVAARTNEEKEKERHHKAMLVAAFDEDQFQRYEIWRQSKLGDAIVRRLINQTLSQSVPASVILAVRTVTKLFAGEIIERARKVQTQWLEICHESQTGLRSPPSSDNDEKIPEMRRGPLLPDHLREALRRYKLERDGGAVGLHGLGRQQHPTGTERFGLKVMGKRLLR